MGGHLTRRLRLRRALLVVAALVASWLWSPIMGRGARAARSTTIGNPVVVENLHAGSSGWELKGPVADDRHNQIKGFASATSVKPGQALSLYVTVNPAQTYSLAVYRIGWYGGKGGRLLQTAGPLPGVHQPPCPPDPSSGLISCPWSASYALRVPATWTSGVYLAVLTNAQHYQNYVVFVVRDDRPAALLYQEAVTTYQAYNNYPDDQATGKSLYAYNSYGPSTISGDTRAVQVSFDRPYAGDGVGDFLDEDVYFIHWVERAGYDVTYSTDLDTHEHGDRLLQHRAVLSVGHDEYWSREMFDAAEAARDRGVSLGFFGANAVYRQVRLAPSAGGVPDRVLVCYKDARLDPVQGPTTTVNWRDPPVNRPEQTLLGIQYTTDVNYDNNVPYVVTNSHHWVYARTGLRDGDAIPGLVGYEMDRAMPQYPSPPPRSRALLSTSPFTDAAGRPDVANSSIYQAASGAWVFDAGTISWSSGLDNLPGNTRADPRVQRVTANILDAFVHGVAAP
jgi:hypothetical protein